jgi:hypothetical protein
LLFSRVRLFVEDGHMPSLEHSGKPDDTTGVIEDAVVSRGTGIGWPRKWLRTNRYFLARFYARHPGEGFSNRVS